MLLFDPLPFRTPNKVDLLGCIPSSAIEHVHLELQSELSGIRYPKYSKCFLRQLSNYNSFDRHNDTMRSESAHQASKQFFGYRAVRIKIKMI